MEQISLDIETYSGVSLPRAGVYRYAGSADFEILLLSYAVDGGLPRWLIWRGRGAAGGDPSGAVRSQHHQVGLQREL